MNIKAPGLKPILDLVYPVFQQLVVGDWVLVVDGVEAQIPADATLVLSESSGKIKIEVEGTGVAIRVDPSKLTFIPCRSLEYGSIPRGTVDPQGVDLTVRGFPLLSSVRLEAGE